MIKDALGRCAYSNWLVVLLKSSFCLFVFGSLAFYWYTCDCLCFEPLVYGRQARVESSFTLVTNNWTDLHFTSIRATSRHKHPSTRYTSRSLAKPHQSHHHENHASLRLISRHSPPPPYTNRTISIHLPQARPLPRPRKQQFRRRFHLYLRPQPPNLVLQLRSRTLICIRL